MTMTIGINRLPRLLDRLTPNYIKKKAVVPGKANATSFTLSV
jgi:hypothetical protein